jgi:hypothetical protein
MADAVDAGKAALTKVATGKSEQVFLRVHYRIAIARSVSGLIVWKLQVKAYLEATVVPVLTQGLTQMCVAEPEDPFTWLAQVWTCIPPV